MLKKLISLLSVLLILSATLTTFTTASAGSASAEIKELIDGIISFKQASCGVNNQQKLVDDALVKEIGGGGEWYALSLAQYNGKLDFSAFEKALEKHIKSGEERNAVTNEKNALALLATGYGGTLISEVLDSSVGKLGIMSYVFALHLMNNGVTSGSFSSAQIIKKILDNRKADGGWALNGSFSDVDVTAMAIQALAPSVSDKSIKQAVDGAVGLLSSKMTESGGFISYGVENSESTAQVIIALSCLGIDCTKDGRFIKNGKNLIDTLLCYRNTDGSYSHEAGGKSDYNATVQALSALISFYRLKNGLGSFYILDGKPLHPVSTTAKDTTVVTTTTAAASTSEQTTAAQTKTPSTTRSTDAKKPASRSDRSGNPFGFLTRPDNQQNESEKAVTAAATTASSPVTTTAQNTSAVESTTAPSVSQTAVTTANEPISRSASTKQPQTVDAETTAAASITSQQVQTTQTAQTAQTAQTIQTASAVQAESTYETSDFSYSEETTENTSKKEKSDMGIKPYIAASVIAAAAIALIILHTRKKGGKITTCVICAAAAILLFVTFTVDIQSGDKYYSSGSDAEGGITVTLSIRCDTVAGQKQAPQNGIILDKTAFTVPENSSVYDVLVKAAKEYGIQIENDSQTPGDNSTAYISGINYLYEFDFGELSGWVFRVNSASAATGCGAYTVSDGDNIEFLYTCSLGEDLK